VTFQISWKFNQLKRKKQTPVIVRGKCQGPNFPVERKLLHRLIYPQFLSKMCALIRSCIHVIFSLFLYLRLVHWSSNRIKQKSVENLYLICYDKTVVRTNVHSKKSRWKIFTRLIWIRNFLKFRTNGHSNKRSFEQTVIRTKGHSKKSRSKILTRLIRIRLCEKFISAEATFSNFPLQ
jgi:hypothetical protein